MDDSERLARRAGPLAPRKKRQSHSSAGPWPGWKSCFLGGVTYLFWETRDAGLPHHWPLSSSKSSPHPPGSRGQAERQLATDTALQRTKTGEGLREEAEEGRDSCRRIKEQNKRAAAERGRGCLLGTPQHHPALGGSPQHTEAWITLSPSLCLSPLLSGNNICEKFDEGPGPSI